mgnify:FL=1
MSALGNAGTAASREACVELARARANAIHGPVYVVEHVGGTHPKHGQVGANGSWMWRDAVDAEGRPMDAPRWVWRFDSTVQPQ